MEFKPRIALDHERIQRAKSAMATTATRMDRYRIDTKWRHFESASWQHGQQVEEVNHFGRHTTCVGDFLAIQRIDGVMLAHVQVLAIRMMNAAQFTGGELAALGYESRAEYEADWGAVIGNRVWYVNIIHINMPTNTDIDIIQ